MDSPELRWFSDSSDRPASRRPEDLNALVEQLTADRVCFSRASSPRLVEQLRACQRHRPERLICSLLDGDPDLPLQAVLGWRQPEKVIEGIVLLRKLTGITRSWLIADAASPPDRSQQLRRLADAAGIRCIFIRNDYPQSDPTLLVYTLLGRRLRPGKLPTEQGVLLLGAVAAWRLCEPLAPTTPFAVRDLVSDSCYYVISRIGWSLGEVLSRLEIGFAERLIRLGDPLRDIRVDAARVIDGSEITVHLMRPERTINPDPCVRCGWCVEGCPVRIQPAGLLEAAQLADVKLAERFGLHACIECGICAYVCPSRLPLLGAIRSLRETKLVPAAEPD
jgi:H+/Na+-translocating ferredoxin:NAD+ oxidoreductase subunit C